MIKLKKQKTNWCQMKKIILGGFFLGLGLFGSQKAPALISAQAPQQLTVSISPTNQYLWLKPGETQTLKFTLQNTSDLNLIFSTQLVNFKPNGDNGEISLTDFDANDPLIFSSMEENYLKLPAASQKIINLKITAPNLSKTKGEHYYSLIIKTDIDPETAPTYETNVSTAQLQANLVSNLIVLVAPDRADHSQLTWSHSSTENSKVFWYDSFSSWTKSFWQNENLKLIVANNGQTSTIINGHIEITNLQTDELVGNYQIVPNLVLPNSQRQIKFFAEDGQSTAFFPYFENNFLLGDYQVKINVYSAHDRNQNPPLVITYEIKFWPFLITIILFTILIIVMIMISIHRQIKKNKLKRARAELIARNQKKL